MCEPTTIAALVLTAAGTYEQARGQQMANKAMNEAQAAESARQKSLRNEADSLFKQSLGSQTAEEQTKRLADKASERDQAMVGNQSKEQVVNIPVQGGAPTVVADETAARVGQGNLAAQQEASAKAALAAFGDLQLGNALQNAHYGQQQSMLANFMNGSAAVLPTEMQAASQRGQGTKLFGDILTAAGMVTGMAGSGGASKAATGGNKIVASSSLPSLGGTVAPAPGTAAWFGSPSDLFMNSGKSLYSVPKILPR